MKNEQDELFELYKACFPGIIRGEGVVREVLGIGGNRIFVERRDGRAVAASVLNGNVVLMLCVLPEYRRRGIGGELLRKSEEAVRAAGFGEIRFCDAKVDYITPGVPIFGEYAGNEAFFVKRGYAHSWGECECVDMAMELSDFCAADAAAGDTINGICYRWASLADRAAVLDCVESGSAEFAPYYSDESLYSEANEERILVAEKDGKICGALLVGSETEAQGVGSVGCTVTRPEYRRQGIATNMVKLGTAHLKSLGLPRGFLGYTYTDIVPMYAQSGYKICMKYLMAVRQLND